MSFSEVGAFGRKKKAPILSDGATNGARVAGVRSMMRSAALGFGGVGVSVIF